jgi:hypothetical protein
MWSAVNAVLNALFDALFWPVDALPAEWQVVVLALPAAVLALAIYKVASNQAAIRNAKSKIVAHLLELRLFRDDLRVLLGAEARVFANIGRYVGHSLLPMVLMLPIFLLMLIQIESRFAFRGLAPEEAAIVTARIESDRPVSQLPVSLDSDDGLSIVTPALRADSEGEVYWKVQPAAAGIHTLSFRVGRDEARRSVHADSADGVMGMSYRAGDARTLFYPHETALPSEGPISAVSIDYPRARGEFAGLSSISWLFFGMVMLYAFALRRLFGVSF